MGQSPTIVGTYMFAAVCSLVCYPFIFFTYVQRLKDTQKYNHKDPSYLG